MNSTKLGAFCDKVLEVCWLLAVIVAPLFFNVNSNNVFERDKWTTLRSIAVVMAAVWLTRWIEERASGKKGLRISWRTPLVLPALLTIVAYIVSTLFSLTPYISVFGGYQRLRGMFSIVSCIVICLVAIDQMRTQKQVDRFVTVLILNSLPIALYGFIQHNGIDPLPWGGDVTHRIASNMGNPIFVAAYMIMVALPTLSRVIIAFRSILTDEDTGTADVLRAAAYIFLFLVQVISIWYSRSRGPLMGLVAGLGVWVFLGLLILQRAARSDKPFKPRDLLRDLGLGLGFGIGSLAAALAVALAILYGGGALGVAPGGETLRWAGVGAGVVVLLGLWMYFVVSQRGWRWLWASALLLSILFAAGFLAINLVAPIHAWSSQQSWVGRLDDVLHEGGGTTGMVRNLIWQGSLDMILPHEPIEFPPTTENAEWQPDRFNALRVLTGYGPESMYVGYNRFYPPLLGHYERRTATPDRSHNETLDTLVTTGLLGFAAYLWTFGSIFYFGSRWLKVLPNDWRRILFFALLIGGAVAVVVVSGILLGPHFFGLAIPIGMVGGLLIYLAVYAVSAYWDPAPASAAPPRAILLIGVLSAIVAHFVELQFGFSCAANRTTFWALVAIFVLVGLGMMRQRDETDAGEASQKSPTSKRRKRHRKETSPTLPAWLGPTVALAITGGFMLGTLVFDFMSTNPERLTQPLKMIWRALTLLPFQDGRSSYGILMVFAFTWLMNALVLLAEMAKSGAFRERKNDWTVAALLYLMISLTVGFGYALVLATRLVSPVRTLDELVGQVTGHLGSYYLFAVAALVTGGAALLMEERSLPRQVAQPFGVGALVVLALLAGYTNVTTNLVPIQADMVYKQALSLEKAQPAAAIELYQRALRMTPREDFFYFELGRVLLMNHSSIEGASPDAVLQETVRTFATARDISSLNTDHSKGLAKTYQVWASIAPEGATREQRLQLASDNFAIATTLSPKNALLRNEWATFYLAAGDFASAQDVVSDSLAIDTDYDQTWALQGDLYLNQGHVAEAIEAYQHALEITPRWTDVWLHLGDVYAQQNLIPEATDAYEQALEVNPELSDAWVRLGNVYASQNQVPEAISAYERAVELRPDSTDVWTRLGDLYGSQGLLPSAAQAYDRAAGANPGLIDVWLRLGDTYMQLNQLPEAATAYERALEVDANQAQVWRVLGGYVYLPLNRLDEAADALRHTLELAPDAAEAWDTHRLLAGTYDQLGQSDLAIVHAETSLELAPEGERAGVQALLAQLQSPGGGSQP